MRCALLCFWLFILPVTVCAESWLQGLEGINRALNNANSAILDRLDGSQQNQMSDYRRLEKARLQLMAEASGQSEEKIAAMRANGESWEQIGSQFSIDANSLFRDLR